jgi:phosphoribosyl-AMP cyclohydrolase
MSEASEESQGEKADSELLRGRKMDIIDKLNFDEKGLIPAVIQDYASGKVLTLCYMNREALRSTIKEKKIYVFRRSKGRIMLKGESSGCVQFVKAMYADCADNSVLFKVEQTRAACHEGYFSCYFRRFDDDGKEIIEEERVFDPKEVYK